MHGEVDLARDERLLDLARVVTMAPLLARDGDPGTPHPSWESSRAYPPLYVIDPVSEGVGWVLAEGQLEKWQSRVPGFDPETPTTAAKTVATVRQSIDRSWLSRALREPRSRFMYVGHVEATESTAGKTALVLNDPSSMYGLGGKNGRNGIRYLTAQDLYAGTRNPEALFKRLSETYNLSREQAKEREFGLNGIQYPDAAQDDEGNVLELSGSELWPMPPRAALVACHSGADFAHAEPFGLVGAFLESGAELVTATRWVMLTDTAFRIVTSDDPFDAIAVAVDEVQQAEDPNVELARWQRGRLAAWRQSGSIGDSPLSWGAITNYYAPDRTLRAEA